MRLLKLLIIFIFAAILITIASLSPALKELIYKVQHDDYTKKNFANNKGGLKWHTKMLKAQIEASEKKNLIFIYFSADWCMPCLEMEESFFPSKKFHNFVKKKSISLLFYDVSDHNSEAEDIAEKYLVNGLPTIILTNHKGVEIDKVLGFRSTKKTLKELTEVIDLL